MLDRPRFNWLHMTSESDLVDHLQYDPETFVMDVSMRDGKAYRYRDIPAIVFARVITARSTGEAFNQYLRKYPSRRLPRK